MNKLLPLVLLAALWGAIQATAQDGKTEAPAPEAQFETTAQKASYALGYQATQDWRKPGAELDLQALIAGIKAGLNDGAEPALNERQMRAALKAFERERLTRLRAESVFLAAKNNKEGRAFLAANKGKPGVKVTASGLQYTVLREGAGQTPTADDRVSVHYQGTRIDGTEFDSSYTRGALESFPVASVIKGWTEALQLMRVGAKFKFFVPPELAYGATPPPGSPIGPHATLVFEVELLGLEKK